MNEDSQLQHKPDISPSLTDEPKQKLGTWATAFVVFKGFVCTGILYMPLNFVNGGWLWSGSMMVVAMFWNLMCFRKLFEVYDAVGGG
jgi:amino acid permease